MIEFLSNWIEQITISVLIISILEMILPEGNLKKYIKVVLGIYIVFCIISPFVNKNKLFDIKNIDDYLENTLNNSTNQDKTAMDSRIEELYIQEIKKDIEIRAKKYGYNVQNIKIDANLKSESQDLGIYNIELLVSKQKIQNIEEIKIKTEASKSIIMENQEVNDLQEEIANSYEISKEIIKIRVNN